MSVPASEISKSVPNGVRYRVACARTGEAVCFAEVDWLASREQAIAFAVKLKAAAAGNYRGITLTLDYPAIECKPTGNPTFLERPGLDPSFRDPTHPSLSQAILTGERMPTAQIL